MLFHRRFVQNGFVRLADENVSECLSVGDFVLNTEGFELREKPEE